MDAEAAARRWAATWTAAWPAHDVEAIVALVRRRLRAPLDAVPPAAPRAPGRARDYLTGAFAEERRVDDVRFGTPVVRGARAFVEYRARFLDDRGAPMTLAGCAVARFDRDGLVSEARDYWHVEPGDHPPAEGWDG